MHRLRGWSRVRVGTGEYDDVGVTGRKTRSPTTRQRSESWMTRGTDLTGKDSREGPTGVER